MTQSISSFDSINTTRFLPYLKDSIAKTPYYFIESAILLIKCANLSYNGHEKLFKSDEIFYNYLYNLCIIGL